MAFMVNAFGFSVVGLGVIAKGLGAIVKGLGSMNFASNKKRKHRAKVMRICLMLSFLLDD
jgi:hypothetical protein